VDADDSPSAGYKWGGAEPLLLIFIFLTLSFFFFLRLAEASMAPIRRFSMAEKGKAPREEPAPLPPKKRRGHFRRAGEGLVLSRPWLTRPPPGFPVPLYARVQGVGQDEVTQPLARRGHRGLISVMPPMEVRTHAGKSPREFVMWLAMPPTSWILLPWFLAELLPRRGPVTMRLQHAGCRCRAGVADVKVVPSGEVFMMHGWGEISRACRPERASIVHFMFDGASTLFFKVFGDDGPRVDHCPGEATQRGAITGRELALTSGSFGSSSGSSGSDESPETSDDSYEPPSSCRDQRKVRALIRRHW
jgi:hypothetical protein